MRQTTRASDMTSIRGFKGKRNIQHHHRRTIDRHNNGVYETGASAIFFIINFFFSFFPFVRRRVIRSGHDKNSFAYMHATVPGFILIGGRIQIMDYRPVWRMRGGDGGGSGLLQIGPYYYY